MFNIGPQCPHVDSSPRDLLILDWVSSFHNPFLLQNEKSFCITYDCNFADLTDASDTFISPDGLCDAFLRDRINDKER